MTSFRQFGEDFGTWYQFDEVGDLAVSVWGQGTAYLTRAEVAELRDRLNDVLAADPVTDNARGDTAVSTDPTPAPVPPAPAEVRSAADDAYDNNEGYGTRRAFDAAFDVAYAAGLAAGRSAAAAELPRTTEEILAWLSRHGLSMTPGAGVVLAAVRADLLERADHAE